MPAPCRLHAARNGSTDSRSTYAAAYARAVEPMSPRFASAITSRPASRAYAHVSSNARIPCEPSASKNASCGLTATHARAVASISPRQKRAAAFARPSAPTASPWSSTGSRSTTGSSPTTSWLLFRSTVSATRSPKVVVATAASIAREGYSQLRRVGTLGRRALELRNAQHMELRRRAAEELGDDEQLVGVFGRVRQNRPARLRQTGLQLEPRARAGRNRSRGRDSAGREEERAPESGLGRRDEQ